MPHVKSDATGPTTWRLAVSVLGLIGYDALIRPALLDWGATDAERRMSLPGDEIVQDVMSHHTKAVTIDAPAAPIWPWLVQIGDQRAGFYSYDWIERYLFPGTVHYVEGRHSATRIHPELQKIEIGERTNTGSFGSVQIASPVTVLEPNRALVIGTWAFVLLPSDENHTRLLVRDRDAGWLRMLAPRRFGVLPALGAIIDYAVGEPLHFAIVRKMMLGIKQRAEATYPDPYRSGIFGLGCNAFRTTLPCGVPSLAPGCIHSYRCGSGGAQAWKQAAGSRLIGGEAGMARHRLILLDHVPNEETEDPRSVYRERYRVPGDDRETEVGEDLAEIVRIPGTGEQAILDQTGTNPQREVLLGVRNIVQEDSKYVDRDSCADGGAGDVGFEPRQQDWRGIVTGEWEENEQDSNPDGHWFGEPLIRIGAALDEPQD